MEKNFNFKKTVLKIFDYSRKLGIRFRRHNLNEYSAYSALFIILSFVPFVIILFNALKALPIFSNAPDYQLIGTNDLTNLLRKLLNEVNEKATGTIISISTVIGLWSAARGLIGIINGLNRIHHAKENRGFIRLRLNAIIYTVLMIAAIIITIAVLVFGEFLLTTAVSLLKLPPLPEDMNFSMRWLIVFLFLVIFFTLIYAVLPIKKSKPLPKLPGAIFTAAGWIGFSALYSVYVDKFANYSDIYGSLAVFVFPILWLYICMYILFLGEEINVMLGSGYIKKALNDIFFDRKPPIKAEKLKNKDKK